MTPLELERLVTLASDVSAPQHQKWEATAMLNGWASAENVMDPTSVVDTLLQTIPSTQNEQVLFHALSTFQRTEVLTRATLEQRVELRHCLLGGSTRNPTRSLLGKGSLLCAASASSSSAYLRTKIGVVLACLIRVDFPGVNWPRAFEDLFQLASPDLFLRTLTALFDDLHQNADFETSRRIKDVLRGNSLTSEFDSITAVVPTLPPSHTLSAQILTQVGVYLERFLSQQDGIMSTLAVNTLKRFVSWADISLVLQDRVMSLVFACMQSTNVDVAVPAVEYLQELVGRGMDEDKKLALVVDVDLLSKLRSHVNLDVLDASPIEVVIEVAKLIDTTGQELLPLVENSLSAPTPHGLSQVWSQLMDVFFRCFSFDDIDVSGAVVPLASAFVVAMGRERDTGRVDMNSHVPTLLTTMYRHMRYPIDFHFDPECDEEAEEEVYRGYLRKLYQRIVRLSPDLSLQFLCQALANLPVPISASPMPDVEASLRLVHHYSEGIRPPPGTKVVLKHKAFRAVLIALHGSDITSHPHREVLVLYYDVAVRYYPIFLDQPELLPKVLDGLSGSSGLQHTHSRVRGRSSYLLLRLVKSVVKVMRPYVEAAVTGIQGLLINHDPDLLRHDDALYLFETVGLLLGRTGLDAEQQQHSLSRVMAPHIHSMSAIMQSKTVSVDPGLVGDSLSHSIAAVAYVSKGFSKPSRQVQALLLQTVPITLAVLESLPGNDQVRGKSMIFLQRMIICLGTEILPSMPRFLHNLIEHCILQDIQDVAQLISQLCIKFKEEAVPAIDASIIPFLRKCHGLVPTLYDNNHSESNEIPPHLQTEQLSIQKLSYTVLQHTVSYKATAALVSSLNAGSFETVLSTMNDGATLVEDPVVKKTCLVFFRELCDQWIAEDHGKGPAAFRICYIRYLVDTFVPEMIQCLLQQAFDERDATQARNVIEFSRVLFTLRSKASIDDFRMILQAMVGRGCPAHVVDAFQSAASVTETELCLKEMMRSLKYRPSA